MEITPSASTEQFAHGFKDMTDYNDIIQVDKISLYGSESKEDQQPNNSLKGQIPVPIIESISTPALLYSYPIELLRGQLPRLSPCYLLLGLN